jgi:hypothetical protein
MAVASTIARLQEKLLTKWNAAVMENAIRSMASVPIARNAKQVIAQTVVKTVPALRAKTVARKLNNLLI